MHHSLMLCNIQMWRIHNWGVFMMKCIWGHSHSNINHDKFVDWKELIADSSGLFWQFAMLS